MDQWPQYLAYVVSFASIGAARMAHTAITDHLTSTTGGLMRVNLLLLLLVSFLPFPTKLVGEYVEESEPERVAVTLYGVVLLLIALTTAALWRLALRSGAVTTDVDRDVASLTRRLEPGLAGYVAMIVLGLFLPVAAVAGYLLIALALLVPLGWLRDRRTDTP